MKDDFGGERFADKLIEDYVGANSEERSYHRLWDSRLFNYGNWEVLRFLFSNPWWWLEEFRLDGFQFDGVTSMYHHGINKPFTGNYNEYFSKATDVDAVVFLMLSNCLIHNILPNATVNIHLLYRQHEKLQQIMSALGYSEKVPPRVQAENDAKLTALMQELLSLKDATEHLDCEADERS